MSFAINRLKLLRPYILSHKKQVIIGSLCLIIVSLLALPTPYLMKYIIDEVLANKNLRLLNIIVLLLVGIQVLELVFSFLTSYLFGIFGQEALTSLKKNLFQHLLSLPLSFFDRNQTGYVLSRIGEVEGLNFFFSDIMVRILIGIFEFIFSLVILFHLNWKLTLISLCILPLLFLATRLYSKGIRRVSREVMEKGAVVNRQVQEALSGVDVVKVFSAEERETARIHNFLEDYKRASIKRTVTFSLSSELLSLIGAAGGFLVLWYSGWDIIKGSFTLGSYIAFSGYLAKLYGPTQMLASVGLSFQPAFTALQRVSELMDLEREAKDSGIKLSKFQGEIEFRGVSFSYDSKPALREVSFKISPGEKVLISGPNGSGKSTLVKLILGLYRVSEGEILIDGYRAQDISLSSLRNRISIVSQNTFLFNDTIWNNILYSRPEASEEEVEKVAKLSGVEEFALKLEGGYQTVVGETGKRLSGGERQKIAIARALLKDSDILIFDEATTHLDKESERRIEELVNHDFGQKTCLVISHQRQDIEEFDKVIELEEGQVTIREPQNAYSLSDTFGDDRMKA
ncbi:MAG TPA: ABC transporter ATP-binding protein [Candidatus Saccharicenans sp.]|nr:ABC transporter ATP-binding protein [Candidatus Saccharicenans sp.]HOP61012.1 ABC transporter ATP-binding protein [Candidatus Saccharicenans sp.]HPU93868.1 ABC transporter ATP-binding protein [Candidatus Saccharicenans sp.]HQM74888.1 ABC transporter ATP-binding protein [Candidatus Saccharicenans sp.]